MSCRMELGGEIQTLRLMGVRMKIKRESWVFISAYGPGSVRSGEEIEEFWSELSECVGSFGMNESVLVLGDLNPERKMKCLIG